MSAASLESVAVIVCTHNRHESLRRTLESLSGCAIPSSVTCRVWVVDNASTDRTREVAEEFRERLDLRYVLEAELGLSRARNRAIEEARGYDLLLFTDDDVRVEKNWIAAYIAAAVAHQEASFFGGRVTPMFPDGRPGWYRDARMDLLDGLFVSYDLGDVTRTLSAADILPVGASMGFRPHCFEDGALFRTDLGVCGDDLARGEDTEFLARLQRSGRIGVYVANALSHHEVAGKRLTLSYAFRYGLACEGGHGSRLAAAGYAVRGLRQLVLGRGDRARQCVIRAGMEIRAGRRK